MWLFNKKHPIDLNGFKDCHSHILPGVDDGVEKIEDSLLILEEYERMGISEVVFTPHIMEDVPNKPAILAQQFAELSSIYLGTIALHLAAENMMDSLFQDRLATRDLLPIGKKGKHLLVETSYYNPPMNMERLIVQIKENGYTPILAHPERYQYMGFEDYISWRQKGVLLQLNVPSLVGAYGPEVQWKAEKLLEKGAYDCCGTDTHSIQMVDYFLNSKLAKKTVKKVQELSEKQEL